ncbi:SRPBCC family protein [Litorivivens sp.]|uniref:SRPBCC family protein n=2 Tax=Litorivivens sp. TaxID=2020868 RepID=UPI003565D39B
MIQAEHSIAINAPITSVWHYVKDIEKWANLFPGCKECQIINDNESKWLIKVGAGGMVKTVNVLVDVTAWAGPEQVSFAFKLENEPVSGTGLYRAETTAPGITHITMGVEVAGRGSMAPMWEAVSKPLLPQLAKVFASSLKAEIESATQPETSPSIWQKFTTYFGNLWLALRGTTVIEQDNAVIENHKSLVLTFIQAMGAGDRETAAGCLNSDAITVAKGYGNFSGVREYDTIVGTIEAFTQLFPGGLQPDILTVTGEGERVIVEFEGNGKTFTGVEYHNQYCMVFTLKNGKIHQVNEYFCNKLADDVLWPLIADSQSGT